MEIQNTIKNVLLQTVALSIILIVIGIMVLGCSGDKNPVMNAISIYGSYFGGITTLAAAYIASKLVNDWRKQERTIFIRNVAYETSGLIIRLFNIMQGYSDSNSKITNQFMPIQSEITLKLSILNRQIKDNQMKLVNQNFPLFMKEYIKAIELHQHEPQALKGEVSKLINSYGAELGYLAKLADIDNVFEKLKEALT